ncbi:MAG: mechanosensitive ion channel [Akkermansiaceae bacterium]|nr:mechanosensitive ion channel [Akkermansiaceae bacterium]
METLNEWMDVLGPFGPWASAIIILVVGMLVSKFIAKCIEVGLGKTTIDQKAAELLNLPSNNVEKAVARLVYWILMLYVLVIAIGAAGMGEQVTQPLNALLNEVTGFLPNLIGAIVFGIVAYAVATIVKKILVGLLTAAKLDERLKLGDDKPLTSALGNITFCLIILVLLPGVLQALGVDAVSGPVEELVATILAYLPNLFAGGILIAVGIFVANIVYKMLGSALDASGLDKIPQKLGHEGELKFMDKPLSEVISYVVMITILVYTIAQALVVMDLGEISELAELIKNVWGGIVLFLIGLFVAGIARNTIAKKSERWAFISYVAILVFVGGMALQAANLTLLSDIAILYIVVGAIATTAVAFGIGGAIAIGLGGRESVQRYLAKKQDN